MGDRQPGQRGWTPDGAGFRVGDRVRVSNTDNRFHGLEGVLRDVDGDDGYMATPEGPWCAFDYAELVLLERDGVVLHKSVSPPDEHG